MNFQNEVANWMLKCFGATIALDKTERNHRFLEEALELVQSCECTASEAHQLVDYVFNRPTGETGQEIGWVMVTLAALCTASNDHMENCGWVELHRVSKPHIIELIREKQANKPKHSPLPEELTHQECILKYTRLLPEVSTNTPMPKVKPPKEELIRVETMHDTHKVFRVKDSTLLGCVGRYIEKESFSFKQIRLCNQPSDSEMKEIQKFIHSLNN